MLPWHDLPAITIEIYNCHLQKIRQLSRNGICCMIALFLLSISACDFHLKLLIHMLFAMKLSVCFYRPWRRHIESFPLSRESDWNASTSLRRRVTKIMRSRETFSLNLQWRCASRWDHTVHAQLLPTPQQQTFRERNNKIHVNLAGPSQRGN